MKTHLPISVLCASLVVISCSKKQAEEPNTQQNDSAQSQRESIPETQPLDPQTSEEMAKDMGMVLDFNHPEDYMSKIVELIQQAKTANDANTIIELIGENSLTQEQRNQLRTLITENGLKINLSTPFEKIGELKASQHARWAINLKNNSPIVLDVKRNTAGKWKVEKVTLPEKLALADSESPQLPDTQSDALNYTHTFLNQLLKQDFQSAKAMVDALNITDAKLAGLCIIFEEASYKIDKTKPLRALFMRDTAAGFYINVTSSDDQKAAQFSIITQRDNKEADWKIYEINLDQLLGDYAQRVSGGDIHYTPLLKNPQGEDTLAIYFKFDSEELTPRTEKQLKIVTHLLKLDPSKAITISGHTDAVGGKQYNNALSFKRATTVKNYFINQGVLPAQIITESHGAQHPRLPNTKEDGSDNPEGRRANRRTEIYLDF